MNKLKVSLITCFLLCLTSVMAQNTNLCQQLDIWMNNYILKLEQKYDSNEKDSLNKYLTKLINAPKLKDCDYLMRARDMQERISRNEPIANILYTYAALQGDKEAQYKLGKCYYEGSMEVKKNDKIAKSWLEKAVNQGHIDACYYMGMLFYQKDEEEAIEYFSRAYSNNDAQYMLGYCYELGKCGVRENVETARKHYEKARNGVEHGADAHLRLGLLYESGKGGPKDLGKAIALYQEASKRGQKEAKQLLSNAFDNGIRYFEAKDYESAKEWFNIAKEQNHKDADQYLKAITGNTTANYEIGIKYYKEKKYSMALNCLEVVVNQLEENQHQSYYDYLYNAALAMGAIYENGDGAAIAIDLSEARKYYTIAADGGIVGAQWNLSKFYRDGLGGCEKEPAKEVELLTMAANKGEANAQYMMGYYYEFGDRKKYGIEKNRDKAYEWYRKAAAQGQRKAKEKLDESTRN